MRITFATAVVTLLFAPLGVRADFVAVEFNGGVYRVNHNTGVRTLVGMSGINRLNSGARDASGTFYSVGGDPNRVLVTINTVTGAATQVATLDPTVDPSVSYRSLAFSPDGILFGVRQRALTPGPADFVTIDVGTGSVSVIAGGFDYEGIQGLEFSPAGILYGFQLGNGGPGLITINPVTGALTDVNPSENGGGIQGLGFAPNGTLYGIDSTRLYKVDVLTGSREIVGTGSSVDLRSLDFIPIPEPASFLMLSMGALGMLGVVGRRQRQSGRQTAAVG